MNTCSGKTNDGSPCPCRRFKGRKNQQDDEPAFCVNCEHYDTCHPDSDGPLTQQVPPAAQSSNISAMVSKYTHLLPKMKATEDIARKETNNGFRKKEESRSGPSGSKAKTVYKKEIDAELKKIAVGSIVMITTGFLHGKHKLKSEVAPNARKMEALREAKLLVSESSNGQPVKFSKDMTTEEIDKYLRDLFPDLFQYLDKKGGKSGVDFHWALLVKAGTRLSLSSQKTPNGGDFTANRNPTGRRWEEQRIYISTVTEVRPDVYGDWKAAVEAAESDCEESGADDLPLPATRKNEKRRRSPSPLFDKSVDSDIEIVDPKGTERGIKTYTKPTVKRRKVTVSTVDFAKLNMDDLSDIEIMSNISMSMPPDTDSTSNNRERRRSDSINQLDHSAASKSLPVGANSMTQALLMPTPVDHTWEFNQSTEMSNDGTEMMFHPIEDLPMHTYLTSDLNSIESNRFKDESDETANFFSNMLIPPPEMTPGLPSQSTAHSESINENPTTGPASPHVEASIENATNVLSSSTSAPMNMKNWGNSYQASSSRSKFEALVRPKTNPWVRK
ncbi:hypothetical protein BJ138DRAFT_1131123 [Hygrophoropsis aurantiaca]|uniref:Uncharacterized protein n=1 Tax=Hygrophoropsis aurantiaca TaxID=72124 RepID=A0ACB7ZTS0_9AGAM|nr:hypothetical protein BJ138DRAFT_1131123 [Hygrophoropsis aurantiaca]